MWEVWISFSTTLKLGNEPSSKHDTYEEAVEAAEYVLDHSKLLTRLVICNPGGVVVLEIPELQ